MLSIRGVSKSFGALRALKQVSFEIEEDRVHGIIGPVCARLAFTPRFMSTFHQPVVGDEVCPRRKTVDVVDLVVIEFL